VPPFEVAFDPVEMEADPPLVADSSRCDADCQLFAADLAALTGGVDGERKGRDANALALAADALEAYDVDRSDPVTDIAAAARQLFAADLAALAGGADDERKGRDANALMFADDAAAVGPHFHGSTDEPLVPQVAAPRTDKVPGMASPQALGSDGP